jgi:hypothetical protein
LIEQATANSDSEQRQRTATANSDSEQRASSEFWVGVKDHLRTSYSVEDLANAR